MSSRDDLYTQAIIALTDRVTRLEAAAMSAPSTRAAIYAAIDAERARQDAKHPWGARVDGAFSLAVLAEEFGEVAREVNEWEEEGQRDRLRAELVQVAAVAIRWLESLGGGK